MVYIPQQPARRLRLSGQQQDDQQAAQTDSRSRSKVAAAATVSRKQPHAQQLFKQPERSRVAGKAGSSRRAPKPHQKHAEEQEPDPQQLLAYQAALASQVLQREHQALHKMQLQHSTHASQPQSHQQQAPELAEHTAAFAGTAGSTPSRSRPPCKGQQQQSCQQLQPHVQQQVEATAQAYQAKPSLHQQHQQRSRTGQWRGQQQPVATQLQQAHSVQPVHPRRNINHIYWDVAPTTINPAQVPGLTGHGADGYAAAGQHQAQGSEQQHARQKLSDHQQCHQEQQQPQQRNRQAAQQTATRRNNNAAAVRDSGCAAADADRIVGQYDEHQHYGDYDPGEFAFVMHAAGAQAGARGADGWAQSQPQQQQQQQQPLQYQQQQQQQQQQPLQQHRQQCGGDKNAELSQSLREAESHPDPGVRQHMVKDIKQQMYKMELQQQIAEREAARQASKAAAAAREAAEAVARAAAPPPWDPASKLSRRGGGGEPLRGLDGATVADLRNQKHMLPVPGLDVSSSQCFSSAVSPTHQQHQLQPPQHLAHSASMPAACSMHGSPTHAPAAAPSSSPSIVTPASSAPNSFKRHDSSSVQAQPAGAPGAKCFMGSLAELRAGPSQEQRAAAAAARQQLQQDLEEQMAEKAARTAAQSAAEAARAAAEEAALQQYLLNKSSSQAEVSAVGKEASMVYAAAGPLNVPVLLPAAVAAFGGGSSVSGPAAVRKGRSKRVIDASWLDQLKVPQHGHVRTFLQDQQLQLQQQLSQLQLSSHHTLPQQHSQHHLGSNSAHAPGGSGAQAGQLWQETSSFKVGRAAAGSDAAAMMSLPHVGQSLNSNQLPAALQQVQQLQQEQLRMWDDFKHQAQELQQMLTDKQAVAADRDAARAELGRVQDLLVQQKQLQEAYAGQQQLLLDLQQQQQQQQCGSMRSSHQPDQGCMWEMQDSLDAFVVETQMVPLSVNNIPGVTGDTQAVSDLSPTAQQHSQAAEHPSKQPAAAASSVRNHKSRYSSFYGLEAELSTASVSSQAHSPKGAPRKARTRVSASFRPGAMAARTASAEMPGPSINSSLAASTSFVPFQLSSMGHRQEQGGTDQQDRHSDAICADAGVVVSDRAARSPTSPSQASRVQQGASALAAAAGRVTGLAMSGGKSNNQGSPDRMRGSGSPSRHGKNAAAGRSWAH